MKIGFIGQGWIGRHYADDFEQRHYDVTRYSSEPEFEHNRERIHGCDIVFIAVPTPTRAAGSNGQEFDFSIVREVLHLVGEGKVAVIKSTLLPGTTELLQAEFPWLYIFHSPEFLTEANAAWDAAHPQRNIVGMPVMSPEYLEKARQIHDVLPWAPVVCTIPSAAAELIKYAGNCFLYMKVVYANLLQDLAESLGFDWTDIAPIVGADPRIGMSHLNPVHGNGRGAGGHCFIKDFAAFRQFFTDRLPRDRSARKMLEGIEDKNLDLLYQSKKDTDLVMSIYA